MLLFQISTYCLNFIHKSHSHFLAGVASFMVSIGVSVGVVLVLGVHQTDATFRSSPADFTADGFWAVHGRSQETAVVVSALSFLLPVSWACVAWFVWQCFEHEPSALEGSQPYQDPMHFIL
ncbi:hypothetical protein HK105_207546 [Polyrhizophydium stewartii]|uniref:Uncharacterized protein n=1 Tax=Polyrhizophydium stewartii TaxID=2732419 RepID=A0ABR4N0D7_9FUNG